MIMNDKDAFDLLIKFYDTLDINKTFAILDVEFNIIYRSKRLHDVYHDQHPVFTTKNLIQLKRSKKRQLIVIDSLHRCISTKKSIKFFSINFSRRAEFRFVLMTYSPIVNNSTGNVIGVVIEGEVPNFPINLSRIKTHLFDIPQPTAKTTPDIKLSQREQEILFLLYHTSNHHEIADIIASTHNRTYSRESVTKVVRILSEKFEVYNQESLLAVAVLDGWHKKIPLSLQRDIIIEVEQT